VGVAERLFATTGKALGAAFAALRGEGLRAARCLTGDEALADNFATFLFLGGPMNNDILLKFVWQHIYVSPLLPNVRAGLATRACARRVAPVF
jgi:hypothetical protein